MSIFIFDVFICVFDVFVSVFDIFMSSFRVSKREAGLASSVAILLHWKNGRRTTGTRGKRPQGGIITLCGGVFATASLHGEGDPW